MWRLRCAVGSPGHEYCFNMRARDKAGLVSPWSKAWCRTLPLDDRALAALTGGWSRKSGPHYYRNTITTTTKAGASLGVKGAHVHRLALLVTRCPGCGKVDVIVNGVHHIISTSASTTRLRVLIFLPLIRLQTATIVIRATTAHPVFIDGLVITQ